MSSGFRNDVCSKHRNSGYGTRETSVFINSDHTTSHSNNDNILIVIVTSTVARTILMCGTRMATMATAIPSYYKPV